MKWGARNQDVGNIQIVGRFLGKVDADVTVADLAADQVEIRNQHAGPFADAVDGVLDDHAGAYVCGEVNTRQPKAKSAVRRDFIYSAADGDVGFAPAEKWREWLDRASC